MDNFDLRKYLAENKLTANSRLNEEAFDITKEVQLGDVLVDVQGDMYEVVAISPSQVELEPFNFKGDNSIFPDDFGNDVSIEDFWQHLTAREEDEPKGSFGEPWDSDYFGNHIRENTFKVGQKVTYLGHPAVVTATKEYNGRNFVSVSYDKGTGATKASMILTTSGDVKPLEENTMDNFDLRKYLAENKLTANSRLNEEKVTFSQVSKKEYDKLSNGEELTISKMPSGLNHSVSPNTLKMYPTDLKVMDIMNPYTKKRERVDVIEVVHDWSGIYIKIKAQEANELEAIKSKLEADQKNEHLIFTIDKDRDEIRVGGREGAKQDFVLRNEKEDFGSYRIFNVDDDDRGVIVRITKKK